ncbi:MAG: hypothetical protein JSS91_07070 [Bacteroidetes bacterium]|nr:hypothetical protein [Bacteroidota bacterium]
MFKKFFRNFFKSTSSENILIDFFSGGDGSSFENAVKIKVVNTMEGISNEYLHISIF